MIEHLSLGGLAVLLVALHGLDWHSTEAVRRQNADDDQWDAAQVNGSWWWPYLPGWWKAAMVKADVELNPVMALAIAYLGRQWWLAKVPLVAVTLWGAWATPWPWSHIILAFVCAVYGRVAWANYRQT